MKQTTKLKAKVYKAYCDDAETSRALLIADDSGLCDYENCKGCETERPVIKGEHECLICGQETTPAKPTPGSEGEIELRTSREGYLFIDQEQGGENYTVAIFNETKEEFAAELVRRYNAFPGMLEALKELEEQASAVEADLDSKRKVSIEDIQSLRFAWQKAAAVIQSAT